MHQQRPRRGWRWGGFIPNLFGGLKHYFFLLLSKPGLSFTKKVIKLYYSEDLIGNAAFFYLSISIHFSFFECFLVQTRPDEQTIRFSPAQ